MRDCAVEMLLLLLVAVAAAQRSKLPAVPAEFNACRTIDDCADIFFDVPLFVGDGSKVCSEFEKPCTTSEVCVAFFDSETNLVFNLCSAVGPKCTIQAAPFCQAPSSSGVTPAPSVSSTSTTPSTTPKPKATDKPTTTPPTTTTPSTTKPTTTKPPVTTKATTKAPSTTKAAAASVTTKPPTSSDQTGIFPFQAPQSNPSNTPSGQTGVFPFNPSGGGGGSSVPPAPVPGAAQTGVFPFQPMKSGSTGTGGSAPGVSGTPSGGKIVGSPDGRVRQPLAGSSCCLWAVQGECSRNPKWMPLACSAECSLPNCNLDAASASCKGGKPAKECGPLQPSASAPASSSSGNASPSNTATAAPTKASPNTTSSASLIQLIQKILAALGGKAPATNLGRRRLKTIRRALAKRRSIMRRLAAVRRVKKMRAMRVRNLRAQARMRLVRRKAVIGRRRRIRARLGSLTKRKAGGS